MAITHTCYRQKEKYKNVIREKFSYICQLCGGYGYEVDHVIPFAISHDSSEENLRILCPKCNRATRQQRKDYNPYTTMELWEAHLREELAKYTNGS